MMHQSFDGDGLGQVAGLVGVEPARQGHMVREQVHRGYAHNAPEFGPALGQPDPFSAGYFLVAQKYDSGPATLALFDGVLEGGPQQGVVADRDHHHVLVQHRQRAVLQLSRRKSLGMHVCQLFQL